MYCRKNLMLGAFYCTFHTIVLVSVLTIILKFSYCTKNNFSYLYTCQTDPDQDYSMHLDPDLGKSSIFFSFNLLDVLMVARLRLAYRPILEKVPLFSLNCPTPQFSHITPGSGVLYANPDSLNLSEWRSGSRNELNTSLYLVLRIQFCNPG